MNTSSENMRLQYIHETQILNNQDENLLNHLNPIISIVSELYHVPSVLVTCVLPEFVEIIASTDSSLVFPRQIPRQHSICPFTIDLQDNYILYISDTFQDSRFSSYKYVCEPPHIRFYAGIAIRVDGYAIGSLVLVDTVPRDVSFSQEAISSLVQFSVLLSSIFSSRRNIYLLQLKQIESEKRLAKEKKITAFNLTHNLRTSLSTLSLALNELSVNNATVAANSGTGTVITGTTTTTTASSGILSLSSPSSLSSTMTITTAGSSSMTESSSQSSESNSIVQTARTSCAQIQAIIESNINRNSLLAPKRNDPIYRVSLDNIPTFLKKLQTVVHSHSSDLCDMIKVPENLIVHYTRSYFELFETCFMSFLTNYLSGIANLVLEAELIDANKGNMDEQEGKDEIGSGVEQGLNMKLVIIATVTLSPGVELNSFADVQVICNAVFQVHGRSFYEENENICRLIISLPGQLTAEVCNLERNSSITTPREMSHLTVTTTGPIKGSTGPTITTTGAGSGSGPTTVRRRGILEEPIQSIRLKVLVVEDSIILQKMMERFLSKHDCEVHTAVNGQIGLQLLTANKYHIIFTDFLMPVMNGLAMIKCYKQWRKDHTDASYTQPLILGMSATALESEQQEAFQAGMNFFFLKPINTKILSNVIDSVRTQLLEQSQLSLTDSSLMEQLESETLSSSSSSSNPSIVSNGFNNGLGGFDTFLSSSGQLKRQFTYFDTP